MENWPSSSIQSISFGPPKLPGIFGASTPSDVRPDIGSYGLAAVFLDLLPGLYALATSSAYLLAVLHVPVTLRQRPDGAYTFVEDACVQGIMDGESTGRNMFW
jgi:hypothetical protein